MRKEMRHGDIPVTKSFAIKETLLKHGEPALPVFVAGGSGTAMRRALFEPEISLYRHNIVVSDPGGSL